MLDTSLDDLLSADLSESDAPTPAASPRGDAKARRVRVAAALAKDDTPELDDAESDADTEVSLVAPLVPSSPLVPPGSVSPAVAEAPAVPSTGSSPSNMHPVDRSATTPPIAIR